MMYELSRKERGPLNPQYSANAGKVRRESPSTHPLI
jgi:hypothetical protein